MIGLYGLLLLLIGFAQVVGVEIPGENVPGLFRMLFGVLQMLLAKGMLERKRRAWAIALVLQAADLIPGLYYALQGEDITSLVLTLLVVAALLAFHRRFPVRAARRLSYGQVVAAIAVGLALVYGIAGTYLMRDQFHAIDGWSDAVYFTLMTYSTLGYDDAVAETVPISSDARWFVLSMFLIGLTLFLTALTVVMGPIVEGRMKGVMSLVKRFQRLSDHVVVCGYSGVAATVIDELRERRVAVVIVDDRDKVVQQLRGKGHDVLEADPTLLETLVEANVATARAVIAACDSDSMNTLVAVNAKDLRETTPHARFTILVRIEDEASVDTVRRLGVDKVISPSTLGGRLLAEQAVELTKSRSHTPEDA